MKNITLFCLLLLFSSVGLAQNEKKVEKIIRQGIEYHDEGKFKKAIKTYKKALKMSPNNSLIFYEIAFSYSELKDYKKTIEYCDKVFEINDGHLTATYILKGSTLDDMGELEKSIDVLKEGIVKTEGEHHLLFFNLGINYLRVEKYELAEENMRAAIHVEPTHPSSHYYLAYIHHIWKHPSRAILSAHFFLMLESNTERSQVALDIIEANMKGRTTKGEKDNEISINIGEEEKDTSFIASNMSLALLEAVSMMEGTPERTKDEIFTENTRLFFKILGEQEANGKRKDVWWKIYVPFFYRIAKSEHIDTYCKFLTRDIKPTSKEWVDKNPDKVKAFVDWFKGNSK